MLSNLIKVVPAFSEIIKPSEVEEQKEASQNDEMRLKQDIEITRDEEEVLSHLMTNLMKNHHRLMKNQMKNSNSKIERLTRQRTK
jgi:hypothetical protein